MRCRQNQQPQQQQQLRGVPLGGGSTHAPAPVSLLVVRIHGQQQQQQHCQHHHQQQQHHHPQQQHPGQLHRSAARGCATLSLLRNPWPPRDSPSLQPGQQQQQGQAGQHPPPPNCHAAAAAAVPAAGFQRCSVQREQRKSMMSATQKPLSDAAEAAPAAAAAPLPQRAAAAAAAVLQMPPTAASVAAAPLAHARNINHVSMTATAAVVFTFNAQCRAQARPVPGAASAPHLTTHILNHELRQHHCI